MKTFFIALLATVALSVGGVLIYMGLHPGFSLVTFYRTNSMERRANSDAKDYLKQILNDPDSYQPASNMVDSVFYTRQELVDDFHKYTPEVEKTKYYNDLIGQHKLHQINVIHFYRAKNGFGGMVMGSLKMHYTPSALHEGQLDLEPLILTNPL